MDLYIFQCGKCGLSIQKDSQSSPSTVGCPNGVSHSWTRTTV